MAIPTYDNLFNPVIEALKKLGGSGSVSEIEEKVAVLLKLTDEEVNEIHRGNRSKLSYRLAWSRNYLKRYGILENSSRGVWALTPLGTKTGKVDKDEVNKAVKLLDQALVKGKKDGKKVIDDEEPGLWQEEMLEQLLKLSPAAFERLCQRILRESGFVQVEVTGRSGDGGIDGRGIIKIAGLLSFYIIFQCKRYTGSVSAQQIRDFRGAMVGRADKGLVITTGTFTRDARQEATRDGAPHIDLIEGEELVEKMKELQLGLKIKMEESVEVDKDWFKAF
ncbi:restriction endonuclease [Candidatus Kaiserbacteria bacterium RIFCSPHIGHO2_12_FULL_53_13]|uniref:Restriction endonuclease n=1 Tax=Candidatus Kaiserbacteria bacterium RIFCSPHIGHO2_12_FULL_53_13 TaxID=1798502 RepID=A0A1F6E6I2_9BACT|nr:MAG: restriction endonuclease [Candidatus Kaiserbacteria bacterium RIFCSPHIGHO2_12_FULL_53_13]OGG74217.1 MAG: restriction endonuclease [Candidatus Kaiserbacteria bacterium RIFCSPLOWO2_01_FULL_52_36]